MITDKVYGQIVNKDKNKDILFEEYMKKQSLIIQPNQDLQNVQNLTLNIKDKDI